MEEKYIFFNSSMPRAMSTLLQNILMQNPNIYSTPTDGSLELLYAARVNFTNSPEFKAQNDELMMKAWRKFCYYGLQGYSLGLTDRPNICIKSRGISIHYNWYNSFFSNNNKPLKIICMVRDLRQIFSSMEKMYRSNQENHQPIQDHVKMTGTTTAKRIDSWISSPPIGLALDRIEQVFKEGIDKNILFIRAEDLTANPNVEMSKIYSYINLPEFSHNFNMVEQYTKEDDNFYGMIKSLHTIRNKVEPVRKDYLEILGKDINDWISNRYFWYQNRFKYI